MIVPDGMSIAVFVAVVAGMAGAICGLVGGGMLAERPRRWGAERRAMPAPALALEAPGYAAGLATESPSNRHLRPFCAREFAEWLSGAGLGGTWIAHKRMSLLAEEYCWCEGVQPYQPVRGDLMPTGFDRVVADLRHRTIDPQQTKWVLWRVPPSGALADAPGVDYGHVQWAAVAALPEPGAESLKVAA